MAASAILESISIVLPDTPIPPIITSLQSRTKGAQLGQAEYDFTK